MKKAGFLACLALLVAGCDDSTVVDEGCGNGHLGNDGVTCICDSGYEVDVSGSCSICTNEELCGKKDEEKPNPGDGDNKPNPGDGDNKPNPGGDTPSDGKCYATFTYYNKYTNIASGGESDFSVNFASTLNAWNESDPNYLMTSDSNGTHTITVEVTKGETIAYKYHVNGWFNEVENRDDGWIADPENSATDESGNSLATITQCGMSFGKGGNGNNGNGGSSGGGSVTIQTGKISLAGQPSVSNKQITFSLNLESDINAGDLSVSGGSGNASISGTTVTDTVSENNKYVYTVSDKSGNSLYVPVWVEDRQFDWHDAVLYFAFTDRFADGDPSNNNPATDASVEGTSNARWMGGDYKGLQQKVEEGYFDALGVNTLWISSVSMNTQGLSYGTNGDSHAYSAYHSYWPITTFMTDSNKSEFGDLSPFEPHFGSAEDLRNMVDACHKRGIRVLVDFAANHVHKDSPMFQKHKDWFNDVNNPALCDNDGNWDNYPIKCWFSQDLPDINYDVAEARQTMVDHAIWLIKETNIDGFRVDAVKHMNEQFIKDLRAAIENLFANTGITFYTVGETFSGDVNLLNKYIGNDMLHAQFDFGLYFKLQNVLQGRGLYDLVANGGTMIKDNPYKSDLMGTFMGNHDVARAISVAAGQNTNKWGQNEVVDNSDAFFNLKLVWSIILTNPGVPLIYYGDEYGMFGANDPDNRRMMAFGDQLTEQQKSTLDYVKLLGRARAEHEALRRGNREDLHVSNDEWCFKRTSGADTVIVGLAINNTSGSCDLKGNYKLRSLLDPGSAASEMSSLNFGMNRFQVYHVE